MKVLILRYGFDYEHDNIFGAYSSHYYAKKAKKALVGITDNDYDYCTISTFNVDEKLLVKGD